jgi:CHAD domain-containing protein
LLPEPNGRERNILREIKRIRKRAGKIRDMDVLTADAISVRNDQQEHLIELVQHLGARRHKQAKRLHSIIRKEGRQIAKALKKYRPGCNGGCPRSITTKARR